MDRPWHRLRACTSCTSPKLCVFVDTESYERVSEEITGTRELTFRLGCATAVWYSGDSITHRHTLDFSQPEVFWAWLDDIALKKGMTWVFAHNLGFDLTMLGFWHLLDRDPDLLQFAVLDDPPCLVKTRKGRKSILFVDSLNYWRCGLAELGRAIALPKLPMPAAADPDCAWLTYCRRDVDILEKLLCSLITFVRATLCSSFQPTAASVSWRAWRTSSAYQPVLIHGNYRALRLERQALFGGRLECFRHGYISESTSVLDANSLYPAMMVHHPLPTQLVSLVNRPTRSDFRAYLRNFAVLAEVDLTAEHTPFPQRVGRSVLYRGGPGRFVLADAELRAALQECAVGYVHRGALYARTPLAVTFVRDLYSRKLAARAQGRLEEELATKLILNGLAGKFGQNGRKWVTDDSLIAPRRWGTWWSIDPHTRLPRRCRALAGVRQRLVPADEPYNSCPAIFASITSLGRTELGKFYQLAGGTNTFYTDTDALHVNGEGRSRLHSAGVVSPTDLGALRIDCEGPDAYYWGKKHYRVGDRFVCGCLAASARAIADGIYLQDNFARLESTLDSGRLDTVVVTPRMIQISDRTYLERMRTVERPRAGED
jgi:hypothetical protein